MVKSGVAALVVASGLVISSAAALAAPGDLDPSFDGDGRVTTDFSESDIGTAVAIQADGKIVAAGITNGAQLDFALTRYNTDGSLDTTFDTDGKVVTDFSGGDDVAFDVAIQSDGRIVVAGSASSSLTRDDLALARYNANGSLDTTFDTDGKVVTDFGSPTATVDTARGVAIQADGKIVAAGESSSTATGSDFVLARYNVNGSLDSSLDADGKVVTDFGADDGASDLVLRPDGRMVVAGTTVQPIGADLALARYNTNGSLDTGFDTDGKVVTDFGADEAVDSIAAYADGRVVVAGSRFVTDEGSDFILARYNPTGALDTTLDVDGVVTTNFGRSDAASSVVVQADGRIVAAGDSSFDATGATHIALSRYTPEGALDTSFNLDGRVVTDFGPGSFSSAFAAAVQADGKIVLVGSANPTTGPNGFAIARYLTTGAPTPSGSHDFDGDGRADMTVWRPSNGTWYVNPSSLSFADSIAREWGQGGDLPLANSDFDGDSKADMALWRPSNGTWYVRTSFSGFNGFLFRQWGLNGDIPLANSDFDGDGKADMVVWRPSNGTWYVRTSSSGFAGFVTRQWGVPGDIPLPSSDLDGDAKADMVVWRPSNGTWYVRTSSSGFDSTLIRQWGLNGDLPLPSSDLDGDGKADMVVWRPSNGTWYVRTSSSNFDAFLVRQWGVNGDIPLANSDFEGDGKADMVVWRPSNGTWYVRTSSSNFDTLLVREWGRSGDVVVTGGP